MLTQLRSFLAVIAEGSLNRAATRLRLSQPALSRQMQALEDEVGGRLLERSASGVKPTDAGYALADRAETLLAEYDRAMAEARRLVRGEKEELRVGYLASAARQFLNPALATLRAAHPQVKVKLLDLSPGEQVAALRKGEIDVALIGQEGCVAARDFYTRKLATLPLLAVLPAGHPLAARRKIHLKELREERFVSSPETDLPGHDRWIASLCRKAGFRVRFASQATSLSNLFTLIANENAVALQPAYLKEHPAAGVVMIPLADPGMRWDFLVVWQRGKTAGPTGVLLEALSSSVAHECV